MTKWGWLAIAGGLLIVIAIIINSKPYWKWKLNRKYGVKSCNQCNHFGNITDGENNLEHLSDAYLNTLSVRQMKYIYESDVPCADLYWLDEPDAFIALR